jgi:hypothetical protein
VRGDEDHGVPRPHRVERPEDRGVPDRVRDRAGVELGHLLVVFTTGAPTALVNIDDRQLGGLVGHGLLLRWGWNGRGARGTSA